MDLNDLERWGRRLLEREAKKRGVRDPGAHTQAELIRLILRHDYSARNLRGTAKLVIEALDSAKDALRTPKQPGKRAFSWDRGTYERPQDAPFWEAGEAPPESVQGHAGVDLVAEANERERERLRRAAEASEAARSPAGEGVAGARVADSIQASAQSGVRHEAHEPSPALRGAARGVEAASAASASTAAPPLESVPPSGNEPWPAAPGFTRELERDHAKFAADVLHHVPAVARTAELEAPAAMGGQWTEAEELADDTAATYARDERGSGEPEHVIMGPHPKNGLRLRWRVGEAGIARARAVLGTPGELALRVVAVRVDAAAVVRAEITDHGPVDRDGVLIAPAPSDATRHITSIGLRNATRFVSIAHASD